ncbi:dolichyl-phosphate-mannose--protein mannosyltransferase [Aestuariimicrobium ganziense]|uniref:dolichyl-phosphate-mannose--protein mannosyltransferase n=1 Tax=Aestuariimicrobium ganziense TaxID=2773677 RepID=UPI001F230C0F|nr:phospholipid carrier-dependent glycosyltransferase [Aestuariimicrobium ganziense]
MLDGPPNDRWLSWAVTLGITAFAFVLRMISVDYPKNLVFDETYYPKDAWGLLNYGYEAKMVEKVNDKIAAGQTTGIFLDGQSDYVVHPPLGKWLIAWGEWLFGFNSLGWRFGAVVFGSLLILVTIRLARRLGRSTLVGALAGILLTFDGLAFTMSRIGLLDIFQAFFLVAGVAAVVADRDWFRHRLAAHLTTAGIPDLDGAFGPRLWWRPWRIAAGVLFGCAIAVKWNSMFVLAVMGVLSVLWDFGARRLAGARRRSWWALLSDGIPAFLAMVVLAVPVYLATWVRWFQTQGGHGRQWGANNPDHILVKMFGKPLASLMKYHEEVYKFHTGDYMAQQTHSYEANPWGWLVIQRPIGIDAVNGIKPGEQGCPADLVNDTCLRVISGVGTPVLWWMALIALVAGLWFWLAGRDWRFSVPILAAMGTYLPWFRYADRPLFFFYAICIIPFTTIGLALCLGKALGAANSRDRRSAGWLVGAAVGGVIANFAFIYPILTDQLLTRRQWSLRMWFTSWI